MICAIKWSERRQNGKSGRLFFSPGETILNDFLSHPNLKDWRNEKPTLIVIDNAAAFSSQLKGWLQILHGQKNKWPEKLRLILTERQANFESGWLKEICEDNRGQLAPSHTLFKRLLSLEMGFDLHDRCAIFTSFLEKLIEKTISAEEKKEIADKLAFKEWAGEPLYLMMAAQACYKRGYRNSGEDTETLEDVLDWGRSELVFDVIKREEDRFKAIAKERGIDAAFFKHLAACITLMGGLKQRAFQQFLAQEAQKKDHEEEALSEALQLVLPQASGEQGQKAFPPILPDIVGEAFFMSQLKDEEAALRCYKMNPSETLMALGRADLDFLGFDFSELKEKYNILDIKKTREAILKEASNDLEALKTLAESLPEYSVMLCAFAVEVYEKLLEQQRAHFANGENDEAALAKTLNNLGVNYGELGQREEALKAAQDAAEIRKKLYESNPAAFLPALAGSLNNLGNRYGELGQREEALKAAQDAAEIYRKLCESNPAAFLPNLALSLNNLGIRYGELGQREEALKAAQDAAEMRKKLCESNPAAFLPALADSLNSLGIRYSGLGQREEALKAAQDAAEIYRKLCGSNPAAFLPDLAMSLNNLGVFYGNLGVFYGNLGQKEEALKVAMEAVEIYKKMYKDTPAAFSHYLTISLNSLAERYSETGREEEARECLREIQEITGE